LPATNVFAQEVCVVKGSSLTQAKKNYAASCQLNRVDCDPFNGEWFCASYRLTGSAPPVLTAATVPVTNTQPVPSGALVSTTPDPSTKTPPIQVTPTPPITPSPVTPSVSRHPVCVSASSDSDGDGYGWENSESCIVTSSSAVASNNSTSSAGNTVSTGTSADKNSSAIDSSAASNAGSQSSAQVVNSQPVNSKPARFISTGPGRWGNPISLPSIPVSAANLPDGRILTWAAYNKFAYTYGQDFGRTYTTIFNPNTGSANESLVSNIKHDMFCPGTSMLPDGSVMVTGGSSVAKSSLFNPQTGTWSQLDTLNVPRAYNSNTTLHDGSVMTLGGSWAEESACSGNSSNSQCADKVAEIWNSRSGWRKLSGISSDILRTNDRDGLFRSDNHMWLFAVQGGKVLHAGPSRQMHLLSTSGNGSVQSVGNRAGDNDAMNGNAVMYDVGKILTTGGAQHYEDANATNNAAVIEINNGRVTSKRSSSMAFRRAYHNSVVLPNGEVIVAGGQAYPVPFSDNTSVLAAELWNPVNQTFRTLATMSTPRNYHSIAILLQDGRVLVGGGGLCGSCATNHADVEIFTPPYLIDQNGRTKNRPGIISAPNRVGYGAGINVRTDEAISSLVLVRLAAVTHSVNNDQRRVPLSFSTTGANDYRVSIPSDRGIAPPGNYFLFALNQAGTPSVASVINLQ